MEIFLWMAKMSNKNRMRRRLNQLQKSDISPELTHLTPELQNLTPVSIRNLPNTPTFKENMMPDTQPSNTLTNLTHPGLPPLDIPTTTPPTNILTTTPPTNTNTPQEKTPTTPQEKKSRGRPKRSTTNNPNPSTHGLEKSEARDVAPVSTQQISQANKKRIEKLAGLYTTVGMLASTFDTYTGVVLCKGAVDRAIEMINVAKHHPAMMKAIDNLAKGNDYGALIIGHGVVAYAILAHFGRVPQTPLIAAMGVSEAQILAPPPMTLEQQAELEAAMRAQANGHSDQYATNLS